MPIADPDAERCRTLYGLTEAQWNDTPADVQEKLDQTRRLIEFESAPQRHPACDTAGDTLAGVLNALQHLPAIDRDFIADSMKAYAGNVLAEHLAESGTPVRHLATAVEKLAAVKRRIEMLERAAAPKDGLHARHALILTQETIDLLQGP
jgi:hypothetical protein